MAKTPENVLLAREHLGIDALQPDSLIPKAYLEELRELRRLYPNDTNFHVRAEPNRSYGKIFCEEEGCKTEITLERNNKVQDGGKAVGIGSLKAYTRHISRHATHTKARNARISNGAVVTSSNIKREPSGSVDSYPLLAARRRSAGTALVKPEPVERTVPHKRPHESPVAGPSSEGSSPPPAKKLKQEDSLTRPLAVANREQPAPAPAVDVEDVRLKRLDLQQQLGEATRIRDRILQKKRKTKGDLTRLRRYEDIVKDLEERSEALRAKLPSTTLQRTSSLLRPLSTASNQLPALLPVKKEASSSNIPPPALDIFAGAGALLSAARRDLPGLPGPRGPPMKDEDSDSDDDLMDVDPDVRANDIINRVAGNAIPVVAPAANADAYDANGDFHGRGRDTFQGPVARADDIDKFLLAAGNAEAFDENVNVNECLRKLGLRNMASLLPGMEVPLMPHQIIGVSWMLDREANKLANGGILGDDMGLGKTVQMIAVMLKNRSKDGTCKTNLIVTPKALLGQWKMEIDLKTNNGLRCLIYHGSGKVKRKVDLLAYDVVLTTFQTMAMEWPDEANQRRKEKAAKKKGNTKEDWIVSDSDDDVAPKAGRKRKHDKGLLFQVDFYRIILDEGHYIRNKRNRMSRAVTELSAKLHWILTGTPIINSLADVYGYFRFLGLRPWHDWTEFNNHIGRFEKKDPSLAMTRLQAIFSACLLRRMKDSMLDGKRLIDLPPKVVKLSKLEFMQEERDIYKMVEAASQAKFNRYLRAGTVLKNYSQVLVLLLRLRQICSHPALVQENGTTLISSEEDEDDWNPDARDELIRARDTVSFEFVSEMKKTMKEAALKRIEAEKESVDATTEIEECDICLDAISSAVVTSCRHTFCRECIDNHFNAPPAAVDDEQPAYRANERGCPKCRQAITLDTVFDRAIFEPTDDELFKKATTVVYKGTKRAKQDKGKGKAKAIVIDDSDVDIVDESGKGDAVDEDEEVSTDEDDDDMSDFIDDDDEDDADYQDRRTSSRKAKPQKPKPKASGSHRKPFVVLDSDEEDDEEEEAEVKEVVFGRKKKEDLTPDKLQFKFLASTKMKHMMSQLLKLFREKPDEKVLIISQWTSCLDLVSQYLTDKGITHVKFQGDMSSSKRETAVRVFMSRDKERVMLLSLKCGGVGLNLTRANNVISLDLGWSQAVESQAFDRVHRLGQARDVVVERLVIENSVEDRILALQERKQDLADGSLGEGKGKKIGRLSVKELASLFGLDARGRVLV